MRSPFVTKQHNILIEISTGILLTMGRNTAVIAFLAECVPGTRPFYAVNYPNYSRSLFSMFFLENMEPEDYVKWTWEPKTRTFIKTNSQILDDKFRSLSALAESKRAAMDRMMASLNTIRTSISGPVGQEVIYTSKRLEAKEFKESGYNKDLLMEYPYVEQYASLMNISPQQAADDILLKASLLDQHMAKTELLRLKYFNMMRNARKPSEVGRILKNFMSDCYYK
jgi:hypothetical protein